MTLAQWAIESAYGKEIPPGSNNYFGIKAVHGQAYVMAWTHEFVGGRMVRVMASFAKYPTPLGSFLAHAHLLADSPIYSAARAHNDWAGFVEAMAKHYATAPKYAAAIIKEIEVYDLNAYNVAAEQQLVA